MSYNINTERQKDIYKKINGILDDYLKGKTSGTKHARSVLSRDDYNSYFEESENDIHKAKKQFNNSRNFSQLLDDIKWTNINLYNSKLEYKNEVRKILNDILEDRIALSKDSKNENLKMIKRFENYSKLYEFKLPIMKLDEILADVPHARDTHKNILISFYKSYDEYIDMVDKKRHQFKVNDMTGDIMNNSRVVFDTIIFDKNELDKIKDNVVEFSIGEFYSLMPSSLDIFGIEMKPMSFLNREELKSVFDQNITNDMAVEVISNVTGYNLEKHFNDFYIFSNKS